MDQILKWTSVEEKLPPQNVTFLVAKWDGRENVKIHFILFAERHQHGWYDPETDENIEGKYGIVTHWMDIPDPPNLK